MATVPVLRTWSCGEIVSAAELNSNIRDSVNFLLAPPRCVLSSTVSVNVASQATPQLLYWNNAIVNTDSMWSTTAQSHISVNTPGRYEWELQIHYPYFSGGGQTAYVFCGISFNAGGTWNNGQELCQAVRCGSLSSGLGTSVYSAMDFTNSASDYAQCFTTQLSGGTLTIAGNTFSMTATAQWVAAS